MYSVALVLACLAFMGIGSQVQHPDQQRQHDCIAQRKSLPEVVLACNCPQRAEVLLLSGQVSANGTPKQLKAIVMFFLAFNHASCKSQVALALKTYSMRRCSAECSPSFDNIRAVNSNGHNDASCQALSPKRARSPRCTQIDGSAPPKQVFTFPDGSTYCGDVANGRMCGQGEWRSADGSSFTGGFLDDTFHGYGRYTDANGNCFTGSFQYGSMHGAGTYIYSNGRAEVGTYSNGADMEGVRWSPNRCQAWRLLNGKVTAEISLADASAFASSLSLPVPPSIFELEDVQPQDAGEAPRETAKESAGALAWQRAWLELIEWIELTGGTINSVEYATAGDGVKGMYATRAIEEGEIVCRIPMECCYDYASNEESPVSQLWIESEPDLPAWARLAFGLLYEKRLGKASHKASYIATLPSIEWFREYGPLDMWEAEEIALCESLKFVAQQRQRDLASSALLSDASMRASRWQDLNLPGEPPSNEDVLWAVACVTSRSLGNVGMYAQDLFNHRLPNNAELMQEFDHSAIFMKVIRPIEKGEQVFISYGMYPNLLLLSQYGFMQPSNPITLTLVACGEELARLLAAQLPPDTLMTSPDGSTAEWQAAGMQLEAALDRLAAEGKLPSELSTDLRRESNGTTALSDGTAAYALLLRRTLTTFSCTAAEARSAMEKEGSAMKPQRRMALTFSCEQQDMLNRELARLESG